MSNRSVGYSTLEWWMHSKKKRKEDRCAVTCVPDGKLEFLTTDVNHLHLEVNT